MRVCGTLLMALVSASVTATAAIPGDVNQDCSVGAADALLLWGAVTGAISLDSEQEDAADIAPVVGGASAPDEIVNIADLVVLLRAIAGLQTLPGGARVPTLDELPLTTTVGYSDVVGTACAGDLVKLYVNGRIRGTATAGADGRFSFPLIGMAYNNNVFKATATAAGQTSGDSSEQTVDNGQDVITWDDPEQLVAEITVWPPPPEGYYIVDSDFPISSGKTLILPPGTIVRFQTGTGNRGFEVAGRLLIQGAPGAAVTLRKLVDTAQRWDGIHVTAGSGTLIEHALILGASRPIEVTGANTSVTLRGSELYDFVQGITASAGASVGVAGSWIHYNSTTGLGIQITGGNLSVTDSKLENLGSGIKVEGSSFATIGPGNEFKTFRDAAIQIKGPADGLVIGNEIDVGENLPAARAEMGVNLINSSPEIRTNNIHGANTGIRISGGSNPLITDGNDIHDNIWGIWLEGYGANSVAQPLTGNPNPDITGNSIHENSGVRPPPPPPNNTRDYCSAVGANLCVSDYPSGSNVVIDASGNYWGTDVPMDIRASIIDPDVSLFTYFNNDFLYNTPSDPVAIDLSNFAQSATSGPGTTPLFLYAMTGVSHSPHVMAPTLGDALTVQFTLATTADVTLRIYEEDQPATVLRTISAPGLGKGDRSIPWDGRNDAGSFVPDEAYTYVLTTSVAGFADSYNPPTSPTQTTSVSLAGVPAKPIPSPYNVHRNQPLKILFDMNSDHSRVTVNRTLSGSPTVTLVDKGPFPYLFNQLFVYDGFDGSGNLLEATSTTPTFHFGHPIPMKRNAVIVERTRPLVSGPGYASARKNPVNPKTAPPAQMPAIEVKGEPYLVRLSYDQVSRITFCIDQAAYLTVKILKPGRGNPDVAADVVATLLEDIPETTPPHAAQDCAPGASGVPYVVEWDGTEAGGADPFVVQPVVDGSYTFTIEARNALQTDLRSIYRGIVQTRQ